MKKAGIIGSPVKHSLSPKLHGYWMKQYGIKGEYVRIETPYDGLESELRSLHSKGFSGVNITIPHKERAASYMDQLSKAAKLTGAVNTVLVEKDGSLFGTNTDVEGFALNLKESLPGFKFSTGRVAVVGAGGAARAVCVAVLGNKKDSATEVVITNRTYERAEELKADIARQIPEIAQRIQVLRWKDFTSALVDAQLLVNATSLGMEGQPPLQLDIRGLAPDAVVTDIVYRPLETDLLKAARSQGLRTVDGLGMLLYQAVPAFDLWFGIRPEVDEGLRQELLS